MPSGFHFTVVFFNFVQNSIELLPVISHTPNLLSFHPPNENGSRGTGTPVSNGLREREAEDLISKFMQNRKICCFEITEVNPTLDKENLMAEIAFNILQRSVNVLMMN